MAPGRAGGRVSHAGVTAGGGAPPQCTTQLHASPRLCLPPRTGAGASAGVHKLRAPERPGTHTGGEQSRCQHVVWSRQPADRQAIPQCVRGTARTSQPWFATAWRCACRGSPSPRWAPLCACETPSSRSSPSKADCWAAERQPAWPAHASGDTDVHLRSGAVQCQRHRHVATPCTAPASPPPTRRMARSLRPP